MQAPCCLVFLTIPWAFLELPRLLHATEPVQFDPIVFVSNAAAAFVLNMSVRPAPSLCHPFSELPQTPSHAFEPV